ncbi:MAG: hypothetical protein ACOYNI_01220 [Acidimicrobiia bacterium]
MRNASTPVIERDPMAIPATQPRAPKRGLGSRLSGGHLLMIVAGLVAFVATFALLSNRSATVSVAVARSTIDPGSGISIDNVRAEDVPADSPLANDLVRFAEVSKGGSYAARRLVEGEPLTKASISSKLSSRSQRELVISGNGAVVNVGDRVDIAEVKGGTACWVATNIEVLAFVKSEATTLGGGGSSSPVVAIDDPDQALRVAGASEGGNIRLVKSTGAQPTTRNTCANNEGS